MENHELEQLIKLLEKYVKTTNSPMILESIYPLLKQTKEHLDLKKAGY